MRTRVAFIAATVTALASLTNASGQNFQQTSKTVPNDLVADAAFGRSMSVDGDTVFIGCPNDGSGSVYVYKRVSGALQFVQKLKPNDGAPGDSFGVSISIDGTTAIIGSCCDGDLGIASGSSYFFQNAGGVWSQIQKVTASDGKAADLFGSSVALQGDTAVVGAYLHDSIGNDAGATYVFVRSGQTWVQSQKLTASDLEIGDRFGQKVLLKNGTLVIASTQDDDFGPTSGSAYIFAKAGGSWIQKQKLTPPDLGQMSYPNFGQKMSITSDTLMISAFDGTNGSGRVYVFNDSQGSWVQTQRIDAPEWQPNAGFPASISISGDTAVIGYGGSDNGAQSGAAFVYRRVGSLWSKTQKLLPSDGDSLDAFGAEIAVDGNHAVIGAPGDEHGTTGGGSAYSFVRCGGSFQTYGTGCSGNCTPLLIGTGTPCAGCSIQLTVQGAPSLAFGIMFIGLGSNVAPIVPACFAQVLPVSPLTLPMFLPGSTGGCSGGIAIPALLPVSISDGDIYIQVIINDPTAPGGVGGTNPLRMTILGC